MSRIGVNAATAGETQTSAGRQPEKPKRNNGQPVSGNAPGKTFAPGAACPNAAPNKAAPPIRRIPVSFTAASRDSGYSEGGQKHPRIRTIPRMSATVLTCPHRFSSSPRVTPNQANTKAAIQPADIQTPARMPSPAPSQCGKRQSDPEEQGLRKQVSSRSPSPITAAHARSVQKLRAGNASDRNERPGSGSGERRVPNTAKAQPQS